MTPEDDAGNGGPIDWDGPRRPPNDPPTDAASDGRAPDPAPDAEPDDAPTDPVDGDGSATIEADASVVAEDVSDPSATDAEAERDAYLERLQRLQAEFENYRKRMTREQTEATGRGAQALATELLPVLDGCEAAVQQGLVDVEPIRNQLVEILIKAGLERNGEPGDAFDPERHDAVMHEPADDPADESTIAEVLRTGYSWKGRVLRPAMVKVKG